MAFMSDELDRQLRQLMSFEESVSARTQQAAVIGKWAMSVDASPCSHPLWMHSSGRDV